MRSTIKERGGMKRVFHSTRVPVLCVLLTIVTLASHTQAPSSDASKNVPYDVAPLLLHSEPARYTAEARQARVSGTVLVSLLVDLHGLPSHISVKRGVKMGLDEKAVEAVRHYRFQPAMKDGRPIPASIDIEVPFDLAVNPGP